MQWDLAGSSLGDSSKESGSSLGTRKEIAKKKTGGVTARLPEGDAHGCAACGSDVGRRGDNDDDIVRVREEG
ncbi:hypothetical protein BHM03_00004054 [Ensete ventricosum]|nr:hypothetical protein BHM03_00004054 [Ensete ventricosum]